jgi:GTPase SAR1 family protein
MQTNDSSFFTSKIKIILLGDPTVGKTSIIAAIRQLDFKEKQ